MKSIHNVPAITQTDDMASHYHGIVWLDHHEAKVIYFNAETSDEKVVAPSDQPPRLHIKSGSASGTHVTHEPAFYHDVAAACDKAKAVLLVGPSTAKTEFIHYLHKHAPEVFDRISAIETMARVTDNQLLAEGRRFYEMHNRVPPRS